MGGTNGFTRFAVHRLGLVTKKNMQLLHSFILQEPNSVLLLIGELQEMSISGRIERLALNDSYGDALATMPGARDWQGLNPYIS